MIRISERFFHCPWFILTILLVLSGCRGPMGEAGPVGPAGPAGPFGDPGPAGENASAAQLFIGAEECGACHEDIYARHQLSGHANALQTIEGAAPVFPYDDQTSGIVEPPEGFDWNGISYVIGGFAWMARFVDSEGYLITGDNTQYNFANEDLETDAGWAAYHAGDENRFNCGACHTTGYAPQGSQDNREGIAGTWIAEGIQCERCHGPGSLHAADPQGVRMVLDRDAQLCGACHVRGERAVMSAADGFAEHNQQFSDLYNSQHFALDCVTCHDPHASSQFSDENLNPRRGISQVCESCHWQQEAVQNVRIHLGVDCLDCHMPNMAKSAVSDLDLRTADIRSHQFAINPAADAPQFNEDGTAVMPYLTLDYTCGQCHNGTIATNKEPAELESAARRYHTFLPPTPVPTEMPAETETPTPTP